jgi:hypothetical protein
MHGSIREHVADFFSFESQPDATDPTGPAEGDAKNHVIHCGAFTTNAAFAGNCRSGSKRATENADINDFRIVGPAPK